MVKRSAKNLFRSFVRDLLGNRQSSGKAGDVFGDTPDLMVVLSCAAVTFFQDLCSNQRGVWGFLAADVKQRFGCSAHSEHESDDEYLYKRAGADKWLPIITKSVATSTGLAVDSEKLALLKPTQDPVLSIEDIGGDGLRCKFVEFLEINKISASILSALGSEYASDRKFFAKEVTRILHSCIYFLKSYPNSADLQTFELVLRHAQQVLDENAKLAERMWDEKPFEKATRTSRDCLMGVLSVPFSADLAAGLLACRVAACALLLNVEVCVPFHVAAAADVVPNTNIKRCSASSKNSASSHGTSKSEDGSDSTDSKDGSEDGSEADSNDDEKPSPVDGLHCMQWLLQSSSFQVRMLEIESEGELAAYQINSPDKLKLLLDAKVFPAATRPRTPLSFHFCRAQPALVRYMCQSYLDEVVLSWQGLTLLHAAVQHNQLALTDYLLTLFPEMLEARSEHNADSADSIYCPPVGSTPLAVACWKRSPAIVQLLLSKFKANVAAVDDSKVHVLHHCTRGNFEVLQLVLQELSAERAQMLVNQVGPAGETMLMSVCHDDAELNSVKLLLKVKARVNVEAAACEDEAKASATRSPATTALHVAAAAGFPAKETLSLLLSLKADVNAVDSQGRTPLAVACFSQNVRSILEHFPTEVNLRVASDHQFQTLLHAHYHDEDIVALLLNAKVDPNGLDSHGQSALHLACTLPERACARLLVEAGADVNLVSPNENGGKSEPLRPLGIARKHLRQGRGSEPEVNGTVECLLEHGAIE